jgi:hypothetical protein
VLAPRDGARGSTPLLRFASLLLLTLERDAPVLLKSLQAHYAPALAVDPELAQLLEKAKRRFYPSSAPPAAGLSGILQSLLGGGDARGGNPLMSMVSNMMQSLGAPAHEPDAAAPINDDVE